MPVSFKIDEESHQFKNSSSHLILLTSSNICWGVYGTIALLEIRCMAKNKKDNSNTIALNKKARHDYFIEQSLEAGLSLLGWEVKSLERE